MMNLYREDEESRGGFSKADILSAICVVALVVVMMFAFIQSVSDDSDSAFLEQHRSELTYIYDGYEVDKDAIDMSMVDFMIDRENLKVYIKDRK